MQPVDVAHSYRVVVLESTARAIETMLSAIKLFEEIHWEDGLLLATAAQLGSRGVLVLVHEVQYKVLQVVRRDVQVVEVYVGHVEVVGEAVQEGARGKLSHFRGVLLRSQNFSPEGIA